MPSETLPKLDIFSLPAPPPLPPMSSDLKNLLKENVWDRKFGEPLPKLRINEGVFKNEDADKYLKELTEH